MHFVSPPEDEEVKRGGVHFVVLIFLRQEADAAASRTPNSADGVLLPFRSRGTGRDSTPEPPRPPNCSRPIVLATPWTMEGGTNSSCCHHSPHPTSADWLVLTRGMTDMRFSLLTGREDFSLLTGLYASDHAHGRRIRARCTNYQRPNICARDSCSTHACVPTCA